MRAGDFCFGKSHQNHCAWHDGFGNVVLPKLPCDARRSRAGANYSPRPCGSPFADAQGRLRRSNRQSCRFSRPSVASDMRRLLCRSAARRGVVQRRVEKLHFAAGHPWSAQSRVQTPTLRGAKRAGSAQTGVPRIRRVDGGNARRVAHRRCASSPQAQGRAVCEPRRTRANPQHRDVRRTCSRGGLLFGDFLLATQEKVTRPPGRRKENDRDVMPTALRLPAAGETALWTAARNQDMDVGRVRRS